MSTEADDEGDYDEFFSGLLAPRPPLVEERNHPNHWFNRASDLRASAGAVWLAMRGPDEAAQEHLGLADGFSMTIACTPVYYMLCGLALELVMKARLVQLGHSSEKFDHGLEKLLDLLEVEASDKERRLLRFYEGAMVWAGRYPLPRKPTEQKLRQFWDLASNVLTDPVPEIKGLKVRRGNDASTWENFHGLWSKYAALFEHR